MPDPLRLKTWAALALGLGALGWVAPAQAATILDPERPYLTLSSPHFRVHVPADLRALGERAAAYAEECHATLLPYLGVQAPGQPTQLVIFDHEDTVNGFGFPLPNNSLYVYTNAPHEEMLFGAYDAWLRDLIMHEYTHVLHLEQVSGWPALLQRVAGRSYFPNLLLPVFMIEGLAVHTETRFGHGGRGRDAYYRGMLRVAALEGKLPRIDQAAGYFTIDHPGGELPYAYGTAFYRHLARRYGDAVVREVNLAHASNFLAPLWGLDDRLRALTGKDAQALWDELMASIEADAKAEAQAFRARGPLTPLKAVTQAGMLQRHPGYTPEGRLAWCAYDGHGFGSLRLAGPDGTASGSERWMGKSPYGGWDLSADGKALVHARTWDESRFTSFPDLFRFEPQPKQLERLSQRARLDDPAIRPDGRRLVAVRSSGGDTQLVEGPAQGPGLRAFRPLTQAPAGTRFGHPRYHPRGEQLAVSAWVDGARDLYLVDAQGGAMRPLWRDLANDLSPCWSPDGRRLVFSSDRDGSFQLYAAEPSTRRLWRVSNVVGGLIEPAVRPDAKELAAASYGPKGWDVVRLAWDEASWVPLPWPQGGEEALTPWRQANALGWGPAEERAPLSPRPPAPPPAAQGPYPAKPYDPWPAFRPKTWSPFAFMDDAGPVVGGTSFGQDALLQHFGYAAIGVGLASRRPFLSLFYQNDQLWPTLNLGLSDYSYLTGAKGEGVYFPLAQRARALSLGAALPGLPSQFLQGSWVTGDTLGVGLGLSDTEGITPVPEAIPSDQRPPTGRLGSLSLSYRAGDNGRFAYGVGPEFGGLLALGYEAAWALGGGASPYDRASLELRRYLPLGEHRVLALRLQGGLGRGEGSGDFGLGGFDSASLLSTVDVRTVGGSVRQLPLRGFGLGAMRGRNGLGLQAELRSPLAVVQRGWGLIPLFLRQVHGAAFLDAGQAWTGPFQPGAFRVGGGLELRAQLNALQAPSELRLGVGLPLRRGGEDSPWPWPYADVGVAF